MRPPRRPFCDAAGRRLDHPALSDCAYTPLQWFALVCMLVDHLNKTLPGLQLGAPGWLGRLAFPVFGFVLAAKLARNGSLNRTICARISRRLLLSGTCATPFYILVFKSPNGWWPLNCLFLYAIFVAMVWILDSRPGQRFHAVVLFVIGGAFVEYFWCGLAYCLAAWWYCKRNDTLSLLIWTAATALLAVPNGSWWSLMALPVIVAARWIRNVPIAANHFFYVFYPLHLAVLVIARWLCKI